MIHLIGRLFHWLRGGSLKLLTLAVVILLVWGTLSPVGTLVWWLQEGAESLGFTKKKPKQLLPQNESTAVAKSAQINCYIVFLTGVGDFAADQVTPGEETFLNLLVQEHNNCVVVSDVFPYSVANESLGGERFLAPLWRFANEADGWLNVADVLIKIRNLWRFAISADNRYGPVYNRGIALAIFKQMNAANPVKLSGEKPFKLILVGTSGGAQVALGAAPYLEQWLPEAQLIVVSVGGVFAGTDGFNAADRVYHLQGRQDWIEDLGSIIFPSRWYWTVGSPFNQARRQGDYKVYSSGPHAHDGAQGYFGLKLIEDDVRYVDLTVQKVEQLPIWSTQQINQQ